MPSLVNLLKPEIELTIERLKNKKFKPDPIGGEHFSKIVSLMSSAYKRHGFILEKAILKRLMQNKDFDVWEDKEFQISQVSDLAVDTALDRPETLLEMNSIYEENGSRALQVDAIVYNKNKKEITAYEIKRGNGLHDAGKRRSILRDLLCVQVLLKSYGEKKGYEIKRARSHIIFYYGQCSIKKPFSFTKEELNKHFGFSVINEVEQVNTHFRKRLYDLLSK